MLTLHESVAPLATSGKDAVRQASPTNDGPLTTWWPCSKSRRRFASPGGLLHGDGTGSPRKSIHSCLKSCGLASTSREPPVGQTITAPRGYS